MGRCFSSPKSALFNNSEVHKSITPIRKICDDNFSRRNYNICISGALRKRGLNVFAKSIDSGQSAQSAQADMRLNFSLSISSVPHINSLPDDNFLDWSKLKRIENDIL